MIDRRLVKTLGLAAFAPALLWACSPELVALDYERAAPRSAAEIDYVKTVLSRVQTRSLAEGLEFCGFIGLNDEGEFVTWVPTRGEANFCEPVFNYLDRSFNVLANYHTHGSPSVEHETETPSFVDMYGTHLAGQDGYVVTPGGRLWYMDGQAVTAELLCDARCLPHDPAHTDDFDFKVGDVFETDDFEVLYGREPMEDREPDLGED
ncbi:DUF4329 domain-containing protein [uncultured Algimonas sp.]|uniref:DUF4329 domain-containing protein n=1 Tax=uncultured Algimonas sp. TaxID=1547920 RepID=UPI002614CE8C|nr:DUF4329 domain-containing protein [uncultured Algimonas sp.]